MQQSYVSIWFRYFKTDWHTRRNAGLKSSAFVLFVRRQGKMLVSAANPVAESFGIYTNMLLADARALVPNLQVQEEAEDFFPKVLLRLAEWFIRYSPEVAVDGTDGIIINSSGCAHLWGGPEKYLKHIVDQMLHYGYRVRVCMAASIGCAHACVRYAQAFSIIKSGNEKQALSKLPPIGLRIDSQVNEKLVKLGLRNIEQVLAVPHKALQRRFGALLVLRIQQALCFVNETIDAVVPVPPYTDRLFCADVLVTRAGIEMALQQLLQKICSRLSAEGKGLRKAVLKTFSIDGKMQSTAIGTTKASNNETHLFKLFSLKIDNIAPGPGIELFVLEATGIEEDLAKNAAMFTMQSNMEGSEIVQLIDRLSNKIGEQNIRRYLPAAHYWPERSFTQAVSVQEQPALPWTLHSTKPLRILLQPELITVTAPVPDYPPMNFRYRSVLHKVVKADGPERIEQEWWLQQGLHRDYYYVEDEEGRRYWIFRSGHYHPQQPVQWYLHGFCV